MDWQLLFNVVAPLGAAVITGYIRSVQKRLDVTADELVALRLKVAEKYVTHEQLDDIKTMLRRIEDKLDEKADR